MDTVYSALPAAAAARLGDVTVRHVAVAARNAGAVPKQQVEPACRAWRVRRIRLKCH